MRKRGKDEGCRNETVVAFLRKKIFHCRSSPQRKAFARARHGNASRLAAVFLPKTKQLSTKGDGAGVGWGTGALVPSSEIEPGRTHAREERGRCSLNSAIPTRALGELPPRHLSIKGAVPCVHSRAPCHISRHP